MSHHKFLINEENNVNSNFTSAGTDRGNRDGKDGFRQISREVYKHSMLTIILDYCRVE